MGSACCVAARDRTITNGPGSEVLQRNVRYSPSWSFRWESRGRVAGEEAPVNWSSDRASGNDGLETKYGTYASEEGSPLGTSRTISSQKSPTSEGNAGSLRLPSADQSASRNFSTTASAEQLVEESTEAPAVSGPSPLKLSPSMRSVPSFSSSPLSSHSRFLSASPTPLRWPCRSPGHQLLRQVSDSRIRRLKSPNLSISEESSSFTLPEWSYESNGDSHVGSSDNWSVSAFPEFMATSHGERLSFDSEFFGLNRGKISRSSSSDSPIDTQTCGVCSKPLTESFLLSAQKIIINETAVAAVLICGHVYHAECLENVTSEVNKYDPPCPVCTLGEKRALKLSEKAMRKDLKAKLKRSRNRIVSDDLEGVSVFDRQRSSGHEVKGLMRSSPSSSGHFLRRHFSFGPKGTKSVADDHSTPKKGFFWSKSTKQ